MAPKPLTCGSTDSPPRQLTPASFPGCCQSNCAILFSKCVYKSPRFSETSSQRTAPPHVSLTTGTGGHGKRWHTCDHACLPTMEAGTPIPSLGAAQALVHPVSKLCPSDCPNETFPLGQSPLFPSFFPAGARGFWLLVTAETAAAKL